MRDLLTPTDEEIASAFGVDSVEEITDEMLDDVEEPDTPDTVDVSDYATAAGAAKATAEAVREYAEYLGQDPDVEVMLARPEETREIRDVNADVWLVSWEGGPSGWSYNATGGTGAVPVEGLLANDEVDVECYYSFDLMFMNA